jgi:hypothetical protein
MQDKILPVPTDNYRLVCEAYQQIREAAELNPLETAVKSGKIEDVKKLVKDFSPKLNNSRAVIMAAMDGNVDLIKILLPLSNETEFWQAILPKLKQILLGQPDQAREFAQFLLHV